MKVRILGLGGADAHQQNRELERKKQQHRRRGEIPHGPHDGGDRARVHDAQIGEQRKEAEVAPHRDA